MRVENYWSPYWRPLFGSAVAVLALAGIIVTGGVGVLPFGAALIVGSHYALGSHVEVAVISEYQQQLILTTNRLFAEKIEYFPLSVLDARYEARGGLRIAKYYVLEVYVNKKRIAVMSPKEGFSTTQLDRLYSSLKNFSSGVNSQS